MSKTETTETRARIICDTIPIVGSIVAVVGFAVDGHGGLGLGVIATVWVIWAMVDIQLRGA